MQAQKKPKKRIPKPGNPSLSPPPPPGDDVDHHSLDPVLDAARQIDRNFRRTMVQFTGPVDFPAFSRAFFDSLIHIAWSPGTQLDRRLEESQLLCDLLASAAGIKPSQPDRRFKDSDWEIWPFSLYKNQFLVLEAFLHTRFRRVRGVDPHSLLLIDFMMRQITATINPANCPATNPIVLRTTMAENGQNLLRGFANLMDNLKAHDGELAIRHSREEYHRIGETLAATPGTVVFRNELIELIHYTPTTKTVAATPIVMVPAWINKYYILDLRPENSLVKFLVENGFSVFMISWKNVDASYRDYGIEAYMKQGVQTAIREVCTLTATESVHLAGYCMGAILAAVTTAYLRGMDTTNIRTLSFFAGQLDFSDAGDLRSFIDESQISFLDDLMEENGHLDKANMGRTFSLLRARDLFWNYVVDEFYLGKDPFNLDFLFWNDDGTRMPQRLHVEILRRFYLEDELTEGKFRVEEKSLDLRDIDMDLYSVGTVGDHIAPWKSVYRIPHFVSSPIKFVLVSSGHIAGIINPPTEKNAGHYFTDGILGKGPENWLATATRHEGSWWKDWAVWLRKRSKADIPVSAMPLLPERNLGKAPGAYLLEK